MSKQLKKEVEEILQPWREKVETTTHELFNLQSLVARAIREVPGFADWYLKEKGYTVEDIRKMGEKMIEDVFNALIERER